jgi:tRNA U34 5-carboxymethylaminomethyl modifying GTPase MnmE/TrmE
LTKSGDAQLAGDAARSALATIDKTLSTLTSQHHGTARAGALIRKAVALTLLGNVDAGKKTLADALTQVEPSSVLQS